MLPCVLAALAVSASSAAHASEACNASQGIYCDASKPVPARIANLLSLLTPAERQGLLFGRAVPRLGVPALGSGEALHGVVAGCGVDSTGRSFCPTSFPSARGGARRS